MRAAPLAGLLLVLLGGAAGTTAPSADDALGDQVHAGLLAGRDPRVLHCKDATTDIEHVSVTVLDGTLTATLRVDDALASLECEGALAKITGRSDRTWLLKVHAVDGPTPGTTASFYSSTNPVRGPAMIVGSDGRTGPPQAGLAQYQRSGDDHVWTLPSAGQYWIYRPYGASEYKPYSFENVEFDAFTRATLHTGLVGLVYEQRTRVDDCAEFGRAVC